MCFVQVERNLHDAMNVARNVMLDPRLVPGGGAAEMALAHVSTCVSLKHVARKVVCFQPANIEMEQCSQIFSTQVVVPNKSEAALKRLQT